MVCNSHEFCFSILSFLIFRKIRKTESKRNFPFDGIRKAVFVIEKFCEPYNHKPLFALPILKFVSNKILLRFFNTSIKNPLLLRNTRIPFRELSRLFRRFQSLFLFGLSVINIKFINGFTIFNSILTIDYFPGNIARCNFFCLVS